MTVSRQRAPAAASLQVPIRAPLARSRPRFPVGGGLSSCSTAFAGSRVVHVVPSMTRDCRVEGRVPGAVHRPAGERACQLFHHLRGQLRLGGGALPRNSRNSTGSATGDGQNRSRTTSAATTQVLPSSKPASPTVSATRHAQARPYRLHPWHTAPVTHRNVKEDANRNRTQTTSRLTSKARIFR